MGLIKTVLDLIYPPRCVVCGNIAVKSGGKRYLCENCSDNMPYIKAEYRCEKCSVPMDRDGICPLCEERSHIFNKGLAVFEYSVMKDTIEDYKFKNNKYLGEGLGYIMYRYAAENYPFIFDECDIMCSVPVHRESLLERGFDQSTVMAETLSALSGLKYDVLLTRVKETKRQSRLKSYEQRHENVKDAFKAVKDVTGRRVLLIDDVITTGSTADECAKALFEAGAQSVNVYTLSASFKNL